MVSKAEIDFYKQHIQDWNVVFDVGCQHDNIFDELKPGIEVHMFDPIGSAELPDKIKGKSNIYYNEFALGNFTGTVGFHPGYGSIHHRKELGSNYDHTETMVPIDTLFNYCDQKNIKSIDLLKIDTEGYDFEVIKGAKEWVLSGIKYIQFEDWSDEMFLQIIYYLGTMVKDTVLLKSKPINYIIKLL